MSYLIPNRSCYGLHCLMVFVLIVILAIFTLNTSKNCCIHNTTVRRLRLEIVRIGNINSTNGCFTFYARDTQASCRRLSLLFI